MLHLAILEQFEEENTRHENDSKILVDVERCMNCDIVEKALIRNTQVSEDRQFTSFFMLACSEFDDLLWNCYTSSNDEQYRGDPISRVPIFTNTCKNLNNEIIGIITLWNDNYIAENCTYNIWIATECILIHLSQSSYNDVIDSCEDWGKEKANEPKGCEMVWWPIRAIMGFFVEHAKDYQSNSKEAHENNHYVNSAYFFSKTGGTKEQCNNWCSIENDCKSGHRVKFKSVNLSKSETNCLHHPKNYEFYLWFFYTGIHGQL